jgi:hypothetical protein
MSRSLAITLGAASGLTALTLGLSGVRAAERRRLERLWRSLEPGPGHDPFRPDMVEGLPGPAQRYLLHAMAPGTPLASMLQLEMTGSMRLKPDGAWLPMNAEERLAVHRGFVWRAEAGGGLTRYTGTDYYVDGEGRSSVWLDGVVPVIQARGSDTSRSAAGRAALELLLLPPALLPQNGAEWIWIDDDSAAVALPVGRDRVTLTVDIAPDGSPRFASVQRWGDQTPDGRYAFVPFGIELEEERSFGGYTIPTRLTAGWRLGDEGAFEFFRAEIIQATFR